jgi:hypothetical protein
MKGRLLAGAAVTAAAAVFLPAGRADAACHAFTIAASPANPAEGASVQVTVTRDAAVRPSHVRVTSINGTATGGADFPPVDRVVDMQTETSSTFAVPITDDGAPEGAETFKLHLSDPGGCEINPNFELGPDAVVTIQPSDAPTATTTAATTAAPRASTTRASDTTTTSAAATTTALEETGTTEPTTAEVAAKPGDDDDDNAPGWLIAIGSAAFIAAAGLGVYGVRRMRAG